MSAMSPFGEEWESDSEEEETQDMEDGNDLQSLHGMVNFRISEILPSAIKPLDSLKDRNEKSESRRTDVPRSILHLTEAALKDRGSLSVNHICDWIRETIGEAVCPAGSREFPVQQLRRQMTVESVLNGYPQFFKTPMETSDDLWMMTPRGSENKSIEKPKPQMIKSRTNHWKKEKLAAYRKLADDRGSVNCQHAEPTYQDEPLNLAMKPREEPLNLVIRETVRIKVENDAGQAKGETGGKCEKKKEMKKVFTKVSPKSGVAQWTLKKRRFGLKSKHKKVPTNLKENFKRNRMKAEKSQTVANNSNPIRSKESCEPKKGKDTKIKLKKVGDSYQVVPNKQDKPEETDAVYDGLVIKEEADSKKIDQTSNEEKENKIASDIVTDQKAKSVQSDESSSKVTSVSASTSEIRHPQEHVSLVSIVKRKNQEGVTVEKKPVWIQMPTSSGGVKVVPLVAPNKCPTGNLPPKGNRKTEVIQPARNLSFQQKRSGFPKVTELNKRKKVFKIEDDGSISCLGTLEEVQKSGLMENKNIPNTDMSVRNGPISSMFAPKTTYKSTVKHLKFASEGNMVQKRKLGWSPGSLNLSAKKQFTEQLLAAPKHLTWFVPRTMIPVKLFQPSIVQSSQSKSITKTVTAAADCATSTHTRTVGQPSAPSAGNLRQGFLLPIQQNLQIMGKQSVDQQKESKIREENTKSVQPEKSESEVNVNSAKSANRRKIRRELKNRIQESYYDKSKVTGTSADVPVPRPVANIRPKCAFQAFSPMYSNPMNQFSNTTCTSVSVPPVFYSGQWSTRPPYQVPMPCYNSTRSFPYSHQQTTSSNPNLRPKLNRPCQTPSHTYMPTASQTKSEAERPVATPEKLQSKPHVSMPRV